jgi:manganese/zinc/iron transport system permease protein
VDWLNDLLAPYGGHTLVTVALGSAVLGIVTGTLGAFAFLRKRSLTGDAVSHAALPGIALAFLITRSREPAVLFAGALAAGVFGALAALAVSRTTRLKDDTALGLVLSVFFGYGLVLLTYIQRLPDAAQAGLDKFLFGQAATLLTRDVQTMAAVGAVVLAAVLVFWKEFKLLSFDPDYAASLGFPVRLLDVLLTALLVVAIVLGLQTVGVVLMSALVVAPPAAARQWTDRLGVMVLLSALFGAVSGVAGAVASSLVVKVPTGPAIVLAASIIVGFSLFLAPLRGLVWRWLRQRRAARNLRADAVLESLRVLAQQHPGEEHGHPAAVLRTMTPGATSAIPTLRDLEAQGMVRSDMTGRWALTDAGLTRAGDLSRSRGEEDTR